MDQPLALLVAALGALCVWPSEAHALQPLSTFVASAKDKNPENREAHAIEEQRSAQRDVATFSYLPTLSAQGTYTHNQYEAVIALPNTPPVTVQAKDAIDGYFTLSVPIINVGLWQQQSAARTAHEAAQASEQSTAVSVERSVVQAYFQLLGSEALVTAARASLTVAESNRQTVSDRKEVGMASDLDLQRVVAEVAGAQKDVATANQGLIVARRNLESLTRLSPDPAKDGDFTEDDLTQERPLASFLHPGDSDLVAVRAALLGTRAADQNRAVARAAWFPTLSAQGQEHLSNVSGFTGKKSSYALSASATWRIDFTTGANVSAQTAALSAALAREDSARRNAEDSIYQAWYQVTVGIEKVRAARAQVAASRLAEEIGRDRYKQGVATQLEVIQAERDVFSATVSEVQANADLKYARALLRLSSRHASESADVR